MAIITLDSRYKTADIKVDENGVKFIDQFGDIQFEIGDFDDNVEHEVVDKDTVFTVASQFLGSQRYYWAVCRANNILNPFKGLVPGTKLKLPSLQRFRSDILGVT
ncbi:MAG: hypothetical protein V3T43_02900 [Nitrosomonadaceae bacterium]